MTKPKQAIKLNNDMGEFASVHRQQIAIQIAIGKLEKKLEQNEHYIETLMEANQDPNESMQSNICSSPDVLMNRSLMSNRY